MIKHPKEISRRRIIQSATAAATFNIVPRHVLGRGESPPSDKLNVAAVGEGGMGRTDVTNISKTENIVALCDVDADYAGRVFRAFPRATTRSGSMPAREAGPPAPTMPTMLPSRRKSYCSAMWLSART